MTLYNPVINLLCTFFLSKKKLSKYYCQKDFSSGVCTVVFDEALHFA